MAKIKLRDIPRIVLSSSLLPLSAKEIWKEAVDRGLDKAVDSNGKTPFDTISAYLYVASKNPSSGIVADGILIKMAIQAKRWKKGRNVQSPVVDAVRGALAASERGMIITTSDFSRGARENAENVTKSSTISLVNGEQLAKLLIQYGIGVTRKTVEILELDGGFLGKT